MHRLIRYELKVDRMVPHERVNRTRNNRYSHSTVALARRRTFGAHGVITIAVCDGYRSQLGL